MMTDGRTPLIGRRLGLVLNVLHLARVGAVGAAEDLSARFYAVSNDGAFAALAPGREFMDRAFKAVEEIALFAHNDLEGLFVRVAASFAGFHIGRGASRVPGISSPDAR